jgi:hypothetical protein
MSSRLGTLGTMIGVLKASLSLPENSIGLRYVIDAKK